MDRPFLGGGAWVDLGSVFKPFWLEQERRQYDRPFVGSGVLLVFGGDPEEGLGSVDTALDHVAPPVRLPVDRESRRHARKLNHGAVGRAKAPLTPAGLVMSYWPWVITSVIFTETLVLDETVLSMVGVKFRLVRSDSSAVSMMGPDSPPRIS